MTIERWTDDQLDKLATNTRENVLAISELRIAAEALLATAELHQGNFEVMTAEMRGLRLEIRRIIEEMGNQGDAEP